MSTYLNKEELNKLILSTKNIKEAVILRLLVETGISRFELTNLRIKDIDFEKKEIFIKKSKNLERKVPASDSLLQTIKFYIGTRKTGNLIKSNKSEKISLSQINRVVKNASKRAGLKTSPRIVRHSFAINKLAEGTSFQQLQKQLGHHELRSTINTYKNDYEKLVNNPS